MARIAATLVIAFALLFARAARANMAATQINPSLVAAPTFAGETALVVEGEKLLLDCVARRERLTCRFEAAYLVFNPTAGEERALGAFYGMRTREVTIAADGAAVDRALTTEEIRRLDEALDRAADKRREAGQPRVFTRGNERFGFELAVGAGARVRLVARGFMDPGERWIPRGYQTPAAEARHLILGHEPHDRFFDLQYFVAPIWTWRGAPKIEVEVRYPDSFELHPGEGWEVEHAKDAEIARRTVAGPDETGSLWLGFATSTPLVTNGGLLAGVGGAWGEQSGLRVRLGWEAALRGWLLASLVAETDFKSRLQLVPAIEAASPAILYIIPSAGLGVGMPVQLWSQARVGVRLQASLHFYPAGLLFAADIYPPAGSSRLLSEFSLLFQLGL